MSNPTAPTALAGPTTPRAIRALRRGVFVIFGAAVVVGCVLAGKSDEPASSRHTGAALIFGSLAMLLLVGLLDLTVTTGSGNRKKFGWTGILLGADGRVSTSKTQVWLWTLGLAYAVLFLSGIAIFRSATVLGDANWNDYLILLGGPFAAAVLAKYAVVTKINQGSLTKSLTDAADPSATTSSPAPSTATTSTPQATDVIANDAGNLDLFDTQYFMFNVVAFAYAAGTFIAHNFNHAITGSAKYALPAIPSVLLGLTSASAATYVGNKAAQNTSPRINSVQPSQRVAPQTEVTVLGTNLVPAGLADTEATAGTSLLLTSSNRTANSETVGATSATPTRVKFLMPDGFAGTTVDLVVITAAGLATQQYPISSAP
jgi:hypothetical protein